MSTRIPASPEAEREVLGSVMLWEPAIKVCGDAGLRPEHFYFDRHRTIFLAAQRVTHRNEFPDELAVWAQLERQNDTGEEGIENHYLGEMTSTVGSVRNVAAHARRLVELANLRAKQEGAKLILEGVDQESHELIQEGIEQATSDIEAEAEPTTPQELGEDFYEWLESDEDVETFKLPWEKLNEFVLGGYRRGQTSVLAGRTNLGKSVILDQMLGAFHDQGYKSAIFATEMSRRERVARFLSRETGIKPEKIMLKRLTDAEKARLMAPLGRIPFSFYDAQGWTAARICQRIVFDKPDVAAIDPLNLIPFKDRADLDEAARLFQRIARRANCHLVIVAHLNNARATEAKSPPPVLRDIRDSGMIANNADQVLFLHRETDDHANPKRKGGELYFGKVRNGMRGKVAVEFNPKFLRFDVERKQEKAQPELQPEDYF